jgi:hypothetical protein
MNTQLDLKNLTDVWRTGARVEAEGTGKVIILTPVCRASFCSLAEAKQYKGGAPRYGITLVFERMPGLEGAVDVNSVLVPGLVEVAQSEGLAIMQTDRDIRFGTREIKSINLGVRYKQATGEVFDGYSPSSLWIAAYRNADQGPPECVDEGGHPIAPSVIKSGDWVRVVINPYKPKEYSMLSIGLGSIQRVAVGPAFRDDVGTSCFGQVPGATGHVPGATPGGGVDFSRLGV